MNSLEVFLLFAVSLVLCSLSTASPLNSQQKGVEEDNYDEYSQRQRELLEALRQQILHDQIVEESLPMESVDAQPTVDKRAQTFVRFGKRAQTFVRFGKRAQTFVRFGRSAPEQM